MATLKISDLSVGDWVKMGDERYQIYHLTLAGDAYGYRKVNTISGEEYFDGSIADVCPIPITAEILEKNGFEESRYYWTAYHDNGDYVEIYNDGDKWYLSVNSVEYILCPLHWVHQIQHLLRVWGIDKEINL